MEYGHFIDLSENVLISNYTANGNAIYIRQPKQTVVTVLPSLQTIQDTESRYSLDELFNEEIDYSIEPSYSPTNITTRPTSPTSQIIVLLRSLFRREVLNACAGPIIVSVATILFVCSFF